MSTQAAAKTTPVPSSSAPLVHTTHPPQTNSVKAAAPTALPSKAPPTAPFSINTGSFIGSSTRASVSPSQSSHRNSSNGSHLGALSAIVVGCLVAFVLIVGSLGYFLKRKMASKRAEEKDDNFVVVPPTFLLKPEDRQLGGIGESPSTGIIPSSYLYGLPGDVSSQNKSKTEQNSYYNEYDEVESFQIQHEYLQSRIPDGGDWDGSRP
ncbi:hypothetical protein BY996DRAFT_6555791 [Phakopsora pachyrhizi]|nr:hypothetical protein BY996DRAFT_6555791 [Phakopsora pachyrhizi]